MTKNRLKSLGYAGKRNGRVYLNYLCECGNTKTIMKQSVDRGLTKSCGCLNSELVTERWINYRLEKSTQPSEAESNTSEYSSWEHMKRRCYDNKDISYPRYGAKGITVCQRWLDSYYNFLEDMGRKPTPRHTIDRKENDKGYYKDNCRWATYKEQADNK